ncbi:MAG TPA: hypothetical protein VK787_00825 [Puia sp.]|nr:hypothetical protein [Puia sp.]
MEVHHHPHIEKKNFKEYFLEFLMIFLAVTLGFFAESLREHFVDETRIHEYMQEMVENLQYDSIRCALNYKTNTDREKGMDSLSVEIKNATKGKINANALYYYAFKYFGGFGHAAFNNSAITELKNSGTFRLIKNKNITAELYDYYQRKVYAANVHMPTPEQVDDETKLFNEFFMLSDLDDYVRSYDSISDKTYNNEYNYQNILQHDPLLRLLKTNPTDLERLNTHVTQFEIKIKLYNFWLLYCKKAAEKLIKDIKKEYQLENE